MPQILPHWVEVPEFIEMANKIVEHYPQLFSEIDLSQVIAYACINKDRPEKNKKPFEISGSCPPESFTNDKTYFIKMFQQVWDRTENQKLALVFSALSRIDPKQPGKVKPLDYADQEAMVESFGAHWHERGNLPNLLTDDVDLESRMTGG